MTTIPKPELRDLEKHLVGYTFALHSDTVDGKIAFKVSKDGTDEVITVQPENLSEFIRLFEDTIWRLKSAKTIQSDYLRSVNHPLKRSAKLATQFTASNNAYPDNPQEVILVGPRMGWSDSPKLRWIYDNEGYDPNFIGWSLELVGANGISLSTAAWDDAEAIDALVAKMSEPDLLHIQLALLNPEAMVALHESIKLFNQIMQDLEAN